MQYYIPFCVKEINFNELAKNLMKILQFKADDIFISF